MHPLIVLLLVAVLAGAIVSLLLDLRRLKRGSDQNAVLGAIRSALVAAAVVLCFMALL